ncbi:MAG: hypothetical protein AAF721_22895 [Myxococcota bacterium]
MLIPVGVLGFFAVYYFLYFKKIKAAGGMAAAGETYWREQFGLWPGERVVSMWVGSYYLGPLVPSSMRSTAEKAIDFLTNTTVRGSRVYFCFTDHQRMAMAVELGEDDRAPESSLGMAYAYRPAAIHSAEQRAGIVTAAEAYGGSPHLPKPGDRPRVRNLEGKSCALELVVVTDAQGSRSTLWVDAQWVQAMRAWSQGARAVVDPRYAQPAVAS